MTLEEYYFYLLKIATSLENVFFVYDIVKYNLPNSNKTKKVNWCTIVLSFDQKY